MIYYKNKKEAFLAQFSKKSETIKSEIGQIDKYYDYQISQLEAELQSNIDAADQRCQEQIKKEKNKIEDSIKEFYAKESSSIVTMIPYLEKASEDYEAPILSSAPSFDDVKQQANKRIFLPHIPVGINKYPFAGKQCVLPNYANWQSMDNKGNLLLKYNPKSKAQAFNLADAMIARMLMAFPMGSLRLSVLDPTRLGERRIINLIKGSEELYSKRVFDTSTDVKNQLDVLTSRISNIKSNFKPSENSLVQHNNNAKKIKQGYELVICYEPFGNNRISDELKNLLANGASAGIFVFMIQSDNLDSYALGDVNFDTFSTLIEAEENSITLYKNGIKYLKDKNKFEGNKIEKCEYLPSKKNGGELINPIDILDEKSLLYEYFKQLNNDWKEAVESNVVIKWSDCMTNYDDIECWTKGIEVPVGLNADKDEKVYFSLSSGNTLAHTFVQGITGSGKSKFLCSVISSITMKYSPKSVQLYLFDFKNGMAFQSFGKKDYNGKDYKVIPHARWLVTTQADKVMLLSVLKDLQNEKDKRNKLFSKQNVRELEAYNQEMLKSGNEANCIPRILLVVDECHKIYSGRNKTQKEIDEIFKDIAKQYRAYGIHLVLSSQEIPSEMEWIEQVTNNYLLVTGNNRITKLLPSDQQSNEDTIKSRIGQMPAATGVYSTAKNAYISMFGYVDYNNAVDYIYNKAENILKGQIHEFDSKVWDGELNLPYCKIQASCSLEFGTNTIGEKTVGTFIEDSAEKKNVLLYGLLGGDQAKQLAMRTVITTLRGQLMTRKLNDNPMEWPEIYIINAWEDNNTKKTNIWNRTQANPLEKSDKILKNLAQYEFIHLVSKNEAGSLLLKLQKQIKNKEHKSVLLYIIGSNDVNFTIEEQAEPQTPQQDPWGQQWSTKSSRQTDQNGVSILDSILKKGPEWGIHTILQVDDKNDMKNLNLSSKDFRYVIFQQAMRINTWNDGVSLDIENAELDKLPVDERNARTLFYDNKKEVDEQYVIPLMLDELVEVADRRESVGAYIMNNTKV